MYPNTFYRVSVKALIKNASGEILVLKEDQDTWSLPGGGLDHGELPREGIVREIKEELGISTMDVRGILTTETFHLEPKQVWLMWVVYDVTIDDHSFTFGDGVSDVTFINPQLLRRSTDIFEQMVCKVATMSSTL